MARDTGVPACDSSLRDDEACISDHVPQAQRATFSQALEQSRGAIGQSASNPQTRAGLK